jgi:signal transduction histidine kinase
MVAAIINGRKVRVNVPTELQWRWRTMIVLMIFFLIGYVLFAAILLGNLALPHELVTSPIFLGGAIFVFIVASLTRSTIGRMKGAEEKLQHLNETLELKVEERTRELQDAQDELLRKEKLAMLGLIAGGMGNELRNPLGVMNNAVFFLQSVMPEADDMARDYLDIIKKEIDNSLRIITDLLDFARTKNPQARAVTVHELTDESLRRCAIPENIDLQTAIPLDLPRLMVDPLQIGQVLQNLITNAVQAMPKGGTLRIAACLAETATLLADPEQGRQSYGVSLPDFLKISVADTGEGITPENMKRLFQPLFTTKSRGIGLGLSICKSFVEANAGRIAVESKPGQGATFTVTLPVEGVRGA